MELKTLNRDFLLNINHNFTLGNLIHFGTFNGDAQVWFPSLQVFDWRFPIGTKFIIKRFLWNLTLSGLAQDVTLGITKNLAVITSLTRNGVGQSDTGNIDIEYEQILLTDEIYPRMFKPTPFGASGNMTGTAQLYCEWVVHPTEI